MLVRDCMTAPVETAHPEDTVAAVREVFRRRRIRQLPVMAAGRLIGVVTDRDVRSAASDTTTVDAVMTPNPTTIAPATLIEQAATVMRERKIGALPVVEGETLVGIVSESDLLEALTRLCAMLDPTTAIELDCDDDPNAPARVRRVLERHGGHIAWLTAVRMHGGRQRISFRTRMPIGTVPEQLLEEAGFPVRSCIMSSAAAR
ncbi:MAG TPA: CBS domain-containing protein [Candidatus Binatia bacterium]|jgi:acetoin utilization protein AcuB